MQNWSEALDTPARREMRPWSEIAGQGSRRPWRAPGPRTDRAKVRGNEEALVPIRILAGALGRTSQTIRAWERDHIFPPAPFRATGKDQAGERRLYPISYVERIVEIAEDEGILGGKVADFRRTRFSGRAWAVFHESGFNAPLPDGRVRL
jgi:hypothetical protein